MIWEQSYYVRSKTKKQFPGSLNPGCQVEVGSIAVWEKIRTEAFELWNPASAPTICGI